MLLTRNICSTHVREFTQFCGIAQPTELRTASRACILAFRRDLQTCELAPSTVRRMSRRKQEPHFAKDEQGCTTNHLAVPICLGDIPSCVNMAARPKPGHVQCTPYDPQEAARTVLQQLHQAKCRRGYRHRVRVARREFCLADVP
ncbi:MAG: hypothetical protein GKR94_06470 [Gammaproteobacteria bacterium]|nr:hypothetical protein [Gammaproteobacteria bacterium]